MIDTSAAIASVDLDMLAYDIADLLDRGEYGLGDVTQDDLRAVLPQFLTGAIEHANATETGA
jgi:hypothetical protein